MARFAVSVFGLDRPGIVAAVTRVLADAGCNLEDTSMTILRGHFAMMLVVAAPGDSGGPLRVALEPVADGLDLQVNVRPVGDEVTQTEPVGDRFALVVYGPDRPGLVARVAEIVAVKRANIVDLVTKVIGEPDAVYAMHYGLEIPPGTRAELERELELLATELDVQVTLRPDEPDVL
jgi:glycine cleavage system transcriptional repressor